MPNTKTINAFILARKGSKRLKNKNLLKLGGYNLIQYAELLALKCNLIFKTVISTNIKYKPIGIITMIDKRPKYLCKETTTKEEVIIYLLKKYPANYVVLLQPTSPIRKLVDLDNCIRLAIKKKSNVISGYMSWVWDGKEFTKMFVPNGYFYVYKDVNNKSFIPYLMPKAECIDIDTKEDYRLAEAVYAHGRMEK